MSSFRDRRRSIVALHSLLGLAVALVAAACGTDAELGSPNASPSTPTTGAPSAPGAGSPPSSSDGGASTDAALDPDPIVGLWDVSGSDARGVYAGQAEVRPDGTGYSFVRSVQYANVTVEKDRQLHWLFTGKLTRTGQQVALTSQLRQFEFITEHHGVKHSAADIPLTLSGTLMLATSGDMTGTLTATGFSLSDTWSARKPVPSAPLFTNERKIVPAHPAPSPAEKQQNFATYAQYHQLDVIKPYVGRKDFQAAVHGHVHDTTDRDFYRANPNALRVVDKIIDDVTLAETRARADAYRYTLREKAEHYDQDIETRFVEPAVGMIPNGGPEGGGYADQMASYDSALWTSIYMASQFYRYEVTSEPKALDNALRSLDAMLRLQEITNDWKHFARAVRIRQNETWGVWHQGTGAFAGFEWLEPGNNDMVKGLYYAQLVGWEYLCEGGKTGHEALCARIRTNAKHITDDVELGGSAQSNYTNLLPAAWLYAVVTDNPADALTYGAKAQGYWAVAKVALQATPVTYNQGIVDWSGTHLTSIGDTVEYLLAKRLNLGSDAETVMRQRIDTSYGNLAQQRFPEWPLLKAAFGTGASTTHPAIRDAVSRLEEAPFPKVSFTIDRTQTPDFCMSPYPSAPWKGDYLQYPASDRTNGLNSYPLFEMHPDVMWWKLANDYHSTEGYDAPAGDYLHLYWFARKYGLIGPND